MFMLKIWLIGLIGSILLLPQTVMSKQPEPSYVIDVLSHYHFYDKNYASSSPPNEIEVKEQYSEFREKILRNIGLFSNFSAYSPWFGESGDEPWSWGYSGCLIQQMTKKNYFLDSPSLEKLYQALSSYGKDYCKLSKIPTDSKSNKTGRMLSFVPKACRIEYLKSYNGSKDVYAWDKVKLGPDTGKIFVSAVGEKTKEKWLSLLSCYSREQYPSNLLLEQAMSDYLKLFEHAIIIRDSTNEIEGMDCKISLEQLKSFKQVPLKGMSRQVCEAVHLH
ncbi:hypothetical protein [Hydromonas duriensis]|uniref:Uncharacterized protein n=1 Tax=Hydromonas duriensis TaxID=1527608 RepID=A0A4R6YAW9_9BURK|nr:hypothetical protein [Hydromonas duriensis]TDR32753.1 hypothetical protein DFR44_10249 [Hydromonas duriensis]